MTKRWIHARPKAKLRLEVDAELPLLPKDNTIEPIRFAVENCKEQGEVRLIALDIDNNPVGVFVTGSVSDVICQLRRAELRALGYRAGSVRLESQMRYLRRALGYNTPKS